MFKNNIKIAWRSLIKDRMHSLINIAGLTIGMAAAILIGLWMYDELTFNRYYKNYDRIVQVIEKDTHNGESSITQTVPIPLEAELKNKYRNDFKHIVLSFSEGEQILAYGEKKFSVTGKFMQSGAPEMLSLRMLNGSWSGLKDPSSVLIAASTAKTFFGNENPAGKIITINNQMNVKVTGVYDDIPGNAEFKNVKFISTMDLLISNTKWMQRAGTEWDNTSFQIYAELQPNSNLDAVSKKIKNAKADNIPNADKNSAAEILLNPMNKWHLYNEWKNGVNDTGRIQFVKLFGIIGVFVLLLACINFMNLYTARSEKKAKEVGIRKTIGSMRSQLIMKFFTEALLVVLLAFIGAVIVVVCSLPWFNNLSDKQMVIPWTNLYFWVGSLGFILITALVSGSYPAFYLSSFKPVKVLKGKLHAARFASVPRKVLVVFQFTVSIVLIIGTIVVYRQVQYTKDRPTGYNPHGLLMIPVKTSDVAEKLTILQSELKKSRAVELTAQSSSPLTAIWATGGGFTWKNMDANKTENFGKVWVTADFGKTVGWQFKEGRDFSASFATDSIAVEKNTGIAYSVVINEAAASYMNMQNAAGEIIKWNAQPLKIIGVIKDMVVESPYEPAKPTIYLLNNSIARDWVTVRINPDVSVSYALHTIESTFKNLVASMPFEYKFVDTDYALKFKEEERIGKLSTVFSVFAIFISCLGLFGMASFMAERRVKEIGVRKVLGASIFSLWQLLSKDFVLIVFISFFIAAPVAYYYMHQWLQNYQYRTNLSWWIFAAAGIGALLITLLTVSFQSIKAAIANPVKSLRTE